jgi:hypothetical protein
MAEQGLPSRDIVPRAPAFPWTLLCTGTGARAGGQATHYGDYAYSYHVVARRFRPLLEKLGQTLWLDRPESRLEFAIRQARAQGRTPIALAFCAFQDHYPARTAPNVLYPFWEYPQLPVEPAVFPERPDLPVNENIRYDWVRMSRTVQLILTASSYTVETMTRAGVHPPVRLVPVPIPQEWFGVPMWDGPRPRDLPARGYLLCYDMLRETAQQDSARASLRGRVVSAVRKTYLGLRPVAPGLMEWGKSKWAAWNQHHPERAFQRHLLPSPSLGGIVYTMILNPGPRKSWRDLMSAFVWALGEHDDATLVLRIVSRDTERPGYLGGFLNYYRRFASFPHRCRIVLLSEELSDEQMLQLAGCTTFYVNATTAEGACLPIQEMMAASRPALSPIHTAMRDYLDADAGLKIESHVEPCSLPGDPQERLTTLHHRLNWQSLHDQFRASYLLARQPEAYAALAERARQRIRNWASVERVLPLLRQALARVAGQAFTRAPWLPAETRTAEPGRKAA